ncbi:hypothetical protein PUV54_13250 [Hyphococcus flavus]|uniref:Lipoprotein n=1 Tax=Hyphococcus flavus TaxID=1866326 RepID=A0AAE9ZCH7_9PROT|nr:hypothetical protein [Hyphococcus flavus]WDI30920.1 hypothetical protein PUV54_13250 [Hyphococcus flavus]
MIRSRKVLLTAIFLAAACSVQPQPTTDELITTFQQNLNNFEELRDLAFADVAACSVKANGAPCYLRIKVGDDGTTDSFNENDEFWIPNASQYQALTRSIGLPETFLSASNESVEIVAYRAGLSVSGVLISYEWHQESPEPIFSSIDEIRENQDSQSYVYGYQDLGDNWYLYYSRN